MLLFIYNYYIGNSYVSIYLKYTKSQGYYIGINELI